MVAFHKWPWRLSKYRDGRDLIVIDADEFDVAKVCYPNRDANAKLIAAAPDLYEALVSLAAVARRYLPDYDEHPEVQKADAAIARAALATGKDSLPVDPAATAHAELAECRRDAERYRWLRSESCPWPGVFSIEGADDYGWYAICEGDLDQAIDDALAAKGE